MSTEAFAPPAASGTANPNPGSDYAKTADVAATTAAVNAVKAALGSPLQAGTPVALAAGAATVGGVIPKATTTAPVRQVQTAAANAGVVLPGVWIDLGSAGPFDATSIAITLFSPTAGTLNIYYSTDASVGYAMAVVAVAAGVPYTARFPIFARYVSPQFVNGSTSSGTANVSLVLSVSNGS